MPHVLLSLTVSLRRSAVVASFCIEVRVEVLSFIVQLPKNRFMPHGLCPFSALAVSLGS